MVYKTIDLCAGIGGIRRGFEMTRSFTNVLSAEIDQFAIETYKHLYGEDSANDLTSESFKTGVDSTDYDVLLAGFPCQTFSRIGKQLGFRDTTRGTIFFDIADIISRTNPRAVFLENVENIIFHDRGNTIATIVKTLEEELQYRVIGVTVDSNGEYRYDRNSFVRNTRYFGLPQNRPRAYVMAFSKKIYGDAVKCLNRSLPFSSDTVIFEDVFEVLDTDVDDHYYMSQGYLDTLKRHKDRNRKNGNGFGYCVVNQSEDEHPIAHTILATGGSGKERNLVYQPKEGIAGKLIPGKRTPLNSEGIRVMTPDEWGRLQGFIGYAFLDENGVDKFSFPAGTTDGQKYKQFGNSVSIPVIKAMAEFMCECFSELESHPLEIIKAIADNRNYFTKKDVMNLANLTYSQATYYMKKAMSSGEIVRISAGKSTRYAKASNADTLPPINQEERVLEFANTVQILTNTDVQALLHISQGSANVLLSEMAKKELLQRTKRGHYMIRSDERR